MLEKILLGTTPAIARKRDGRVTMYHDECLWRGTRVFTSEGFVSHFVGVVQHWDKCCFSVIPLNFVALQESVPAKDDHKPASVTEGVEVEEEILESTNCWLLLEERLHGGGQETIQNKNVNTTV